eukprot:symbB.v1.2.000296.t1/scaffold24.1/size427761/12
MGSSASAPASGPTKLEDKYYPEWIKNPENIKDLTGRVALITGVSTSSGLGFYATKALASKGAQCVITVRNPEKGQAVKADLEAQLSEMGVTSKPIVVMKMDNCDFESIRSFTDEFKKQYDRLDIVCNNAGVMGLDVQMTKDGYDIQIQTNHLSHFLMTARLWPLLKATAEKYGDVSLTQVSSGASDKGGPTVDTANLNNPHPPHGLMLYLAPYVLGGSTGHWARYGQSKLANVLFAEELNFPLATPGLHLFQKKSDTSFPPTSHPLEELNRRVKAAGLGDKVKSNSCHPGLAATNLQITTQQGGGMKDGAGYQKSGHSCADGSLPLVMAVAHPAAEGGVELGGFSLPFLWICLSKIGAYYGPHEGRTGYPIKSTNANPMAYNETVAKALWEASEKAVGEEFKI